MWPEWYPHPEHKHDSVVHEKELRSFRPLAVVQQGLAGLQRQTQDRKGKAYRQPQQAPAVWASQVNFLRQRKWQRGINQKANLPPGLPQRKVPGTARCLKTFTTNNNSAMRRRLTTSHSTDGHKNRIKWRSRGVGKGRTGRGMSRCKHMHRVAEGGLRGKYQSRWRDVSFGAGDYAVFGAVCLGLCRKGEWGDTKTVLTAARVVSLCPCTCTLVCKAAFLHSYPWSRRRRVQSLARSDSEVEQAFRLQLTQLTWDWQTSLPPLPAW